MKVRKILLFWFISLSLVSCHQDITLDKDFGESIFQKMKDGEVKALIQFDHQLFYNYQSNFNGKLIVSQTTIGSNLFDQFESNFAFQFKIADWKMPKPLSSKILSTDSEARKYDTTIMIGKMLDKKANKGLGYVMVEGEIKLETLNKEKCIILMKGKIARFSSAVNNPALWKPFSGIVVYKKPDMILQNVTESQVFF